MDPITAALNLAAKIIDLIILLISKISDDALSERFKKDWERADRLLAFFEKLTDGLPKSLISRLISTRIGVEPTTDTQNARPEDLPAAPH